MPFDFEQGVCAAFGANADRAILCAPKQDGQQCWSFDGVTFEPFDATNVSHRLGAMSTFRDGVTIVGELFIFSNNLTIPFLKGGQADSMTKGKEHETYEGVY